MGRGALGATSPRLRGEVGSRSNPGEGDSPRTHVFRIRGGPSPQPSPRTSGARENFWTNAYALLDKPVGNKIFSRELLGIYEADIEPWSRVWITSIACAVLKNSGLPDVLDVSPRFNRLLRNTQLRSVFDHFVVLLDYSPRDVHRCAQETNTVLIPLLRALKRPVAVFIDSVDEYFNKHIHTPAWRASFSGELSPDIWFLSQMSLVEVAYQLRRITKHLKVYASVRKEAFNRLAASSPMVQQYRGSAIDASYSEASLKQIFANNVQRERKTNLAQPEKIGDDPIAAFLGRTSTTHTFTGIEEDAFDYIERHTLLRPRDLMTVGQKLAAIEPDERANERDFKRAVNEAASEIVQEYLNEVAPHLGDVDLAGLLAMIPANVLTREVVEMLAARYDEVPGHQGGATGLEAFAALFETGLLGLVQTDPLSGEQVQHFLTPGEYAFGAVRALPSSHHYLVRSVLSGYISALNAAYADRTDRANVIGNGRAWRDPELGRAHHDRPAAYVGNGPYVHVCYAHEDSGDRARRHRVADAARHQRLVRRRAFRPDRDGATNSRARIRQASLFLFFVSPGSVHSNHCINEVNFVSDLDKPFVAVQIEDTMLPDGMKLMIGAKQTIRAFGSAATTYRTQMRNVLLARHLAADTALRYDAVFRGRCT